MARVIVSPTAQIDAAEIWAYIAGDNPPAADQLLARFDQIFRRLSEQPRMGKNVGELAPDLRLFPVGNYLVFYRPITDGVEIARLIHGARDVTAEFFRD
jgi:toxin ParE1/3/4